MKKSILFYLFLIGALVASSGQLFAAGNPGSRGVITINGLPGMFINPTSGTLPKGEISVQACISDIDWVGDDSYWKGLLVGYGFSDRFELAFSHTGFDNRTDDKAVDASGPAMRYRFLDEDISGWEGSVGVFWRPGTKYVAKRGGNLAFSRKIGKVAIDREIRLHLGGKTFKQDGSWTGKWLGNLNSSLAKDTATLVYGGIEVQLKGNFSLISEISSKGGFYTKTPWAFGAQYKKAGGFGCSLGLVQPGYSKNPGLFFGIGLNFD